MAGMLVLPALDLSAQCTTSNATSCTCEIAGQTNCVLLPDLTISWHALQTYASGPSEYSQTASGNAARLRVSGSTPNIGRGPLEVRGVNNLGQRSFICGPDTFTVNQSQSNFTCSNGHEARQILYQRKYQKNGNAMSYTDVRTGTMTYHPTHGHYHVDDWTTMSLRLEQPGVSDPRQWPIVATGGKIGFCLMDLSTCSSSNGHCRTQQEYLQGTVLTNTSFGSHYGFGLGYGCSPDVQGISVGKTDIYSESLDGMWINLMPGLCNGNYWIVADVDPNNDFEEENEGNNWTAIPFALTQQTAANSGGSAGIQADGRLVMAPGTTRTLTATPGTAYLWSNGSTSRSIPVTAAGSYSCTVTAPCGSLLTPSVNVSILTPPAAPAVTHGTVYDAGSAQLSATGANIRWYDAASGGNLVGTGNSLSTPFITSTTTYYAEDRNVLPAETVNGGMAQNATGGAFNSSKHWQYFDAYQPFRLRSFKVRANSAGKRHFVLVDRVGTLIAEKYVILPIGWSTVVVDWDVPAGTNHRISAYDDNSEVVRDLWRNDAGVSYPFNLGSVGAITGCSQGPSFYYYLYDWEITIPEVVSVSPRTATVATVAPSLSLLPKVFMEGPFDAGAGEMRDDLRVSGLVPQAEPYSAMGLPAVNGGGETTTAGVLLASGSNAIVDWVRVELRQHDAPGTVLAVRHGLVQRDGDVVASDGVSPLRFPVPVGNYFVAVRHRNHLACMTASPLLLSAASTPIDFTLPATSTWGSTARKVIGAKAVLFAGNALFDQIIRYTGTSNDRDPILTRVGGVVPTATMAGYHPEDVNLDGIVRYSGAGNDRDPILVNIGGAVVTSTLNESLP
ncbi:MAG: hypothetical protein JNM31_07530 [Flavobacteriales bacterium]|nr:hypothetical protein [Flavobacteriales bacterium]